jgi:hypothetical protein
LFEALAMTSLRTTTAFTVGLLLAPLSTDAGPIAPSRAGIVLARAIPRHAHPDNPPPRMPRCSKAKRAPCWSPASSDGDRGVLSQTV